MEWYSVIIFLLLDYVRVTIKVVTSLNHLLCLAAEVGKAKRNGDLEQIRIAEEKLKAYEKVCLEADEMATNLTYGDLY